jgi:hypothetical protein
MEETIVELARRGETDREIARRLTEQGHRSPRHAVVLTSTVQAIRLRHHLYRNRRRSHPRRIPGSLTVPQLASRLKLSRSWIYDRINNGTIRVELDADLKLYLFPDTPETLAQFRQFLAGKLNTLRF